MRSSRLPRRAVAAGVIFALLPFLTCGFGTWLVFAFAALFLGAVGRRAVIVLAASTAVYLAVLAVFLFNVDAAPGSPGDTVSVVAWTVMFCGGSLQAACFAPWVALKVRGPVPEPDVKDLITEVSATERAALEYDPELRLALRQRERGNLAREIITNDPALAVTLRIGRPDLDRDFVDGGLIDVNRVPAWVLADLPGFTEAMANRVVDA